MKEGENLLRVYAFPPTPEGFILDLDEPRRRRLLARLHEAQMNANRLLGLGRAKKTAQATVDGYRKEMEETFLPLLRGITELFEDD